ncbi:YraN family protein [Flavobacteriaceae bacterium]|jgi:putative endonuclease|nr:YraN family protein [Flavobacteriaceae bacterium]MDC0386314.1 YraN family protein [Flavobacteriaceae bacterium]
MAQHNLFGQEAEQRALHYLKQQGYTLLKQNYRFGKAEVDLLMQKDDNLICVEVKARSTDFFGTPEQFVSSKKKKLLVGAVDHFISSFEMNLEVRFDIIAFTIKQNQWKLKHIKNAFYAFE